MAPPVDTSCTLLVIDDDRLTREDLALLLHRAGYRVVAVPDGEKALRYLHDGRRPDLILLDMLMPGVDGWRFLEELRHWSRPLQVPIVVITGTILTPEWAAQNGCAGLLRKPFDLDELLEEITRCLTNRAEGCSELSPS